MKKIIFSILLIMGATLTHAQVTINKVIIHIGGHIFTMDGNVDLGISGDTQKAIEGDSTITKLPNVTIITNAKRHTKEIYINGGSEDFSFGDGNAYMNFGDHIDSMFNYHPSWGINMPDFSFTWNNGSENFSGNIDSMMNLNKKWMDSLIYKNKSENNPQQYYNYNWQENNNDNSGDSLASKEELKQKIEQLDEKLGDMKEKLNEMHLQLKEQPNNGSSQSPVQQDTTRVRVGNIRIVINHSGIKINPNDSSMCKPSWAQKNITTHWVLLDLGFNTYLNNFSTNLPAGYTSLELNQGKSVNINLHLFQQSINLYQQHLFFWYGISFEFNNYRFRGNNTLIPKTDSVQFAEAPTQLSKSKLSDTYITIPVMFQYESSKNFANSFRFGLGMNVGYLITSHTKEVSSEYGKVKVWDSYNLNTFRYGPTLRIGYSWFNLYVTYAINGLFRSGTAPLINPLSFGISIIAD